MRLSAVTLIGLLGMTAPATAQSPAVARPSTVLAEIVAGMPKGEQQEIKVLTATIRPGEQTVHHTHRFPVTVYIVEGTFTLELEGRPPIIVRAGESLVEPPHHRMIGYNRSTTEPTRIVIFYVSDPGVPFLDPVP